MTKPSPTSPAFELQRDEFGRLMLRTESGVAAEEVSPVRAFPLAAPQEGISLLGSDGHERLWIARLSELAQAPRELISEALAEAEFLPQILRIRSVSTFSTPSKWAIDTDRGPTELLLKGEEDIRRLPAGGLLIADAQGLQFAVDDPKVLDRHSRKLLERFL
ncbi:MAG: DUF1854 domain-containing protein [Ideonella sp.]